MGLKEKLRELESQKNKTAEDIHGIIDNWKNDLDLFFTSVEDWLKQYGTITITKGTKLIHESFLGPYEAPNMILTLPSEQTLSFDPVARMILGGKGRIDLRNSDLKKSVYFILREKGGKSRWEIITNRDPKSAIEFNATSLEKLIEDVIDSRT